MVYQNWVRYIIIGQGISELGKVYHNWDRYHTELGYTYIRILLWTINRIGIYHTELGYRYIRIGYGTYQNWDIPISELGYRYIIIGHRYLSELGKVYLTQLG